MTLCLGFSACADDDAITLNTASIKEAPDFVDARDGHVYHCIQIGDQIWTTENLAYMLPLASADGCVTWDEKQDIDPDSLVVDTANIVVVISDEKYKEIYEGVVELKSVAREPGRRSKIAVYSRDENVDSVGACVGPKGTRVQNIVTELQNEKIDIVKWDPDPAVYIANALSPAQVLSVTVDESEKSSSVVVPDYQLSLAIGKAGQNARLAAKLTNWKIDIKSESQAQEAKAAQPEALSESADEDMDILSDLALPSDDTSAE